MITWIKKETNNVLIVDMSSLLTLKYVHTVVRNTIKNIDILHLSQSEFLNTSILFVFSMMIE